MRMIFYLLCLQMIVLASCSAETPKIVVVANDYNLGDKTSCTERTFEKEIRVTTAGSAKLYIKASDVDPNYYTPTIKFGESDITTLSSPRDLANPSGNGPREKEYDLGFLAAGTKKILTIVAQTASGHQCSGLDKSDCPNENLDDFVLNKVEIRGVTGGLVSSTTCDFSSQCQASPSNTATRFCDADNRCADKECDCTDLPYCTNVNHLRTCDHFSEKTETNGCFLGLFGPPNVQFRVGDGPNAFANKYYAEFNVDVIGGAGQTPTSQDAPRLVILIDKTLDSGLNLALSSEFKINDKPSRKLKDYSGKTTDEGKDKFTYKLAASDLKAGKNTLTIDPKGDDFAIYKIWIENAKGERIWKEENDQCSYQSECEFDVKYNPDQLACDFTATPKVCKEKKGSGEPCNKNFECRSGSCTSNNVCM